MDARIDGQTGREGRMGGVQYTNQKPEQTGRLMDRRTDRCEDISTDGHIHELADGQMDREIHRDKQYLIDRGMGGLRDNWTGK
jgi:hypothetical protein